MIARLQGLWLRNRSRPVERAEPPTAAARTRRALPTVDIAPNDPLVAYFQSAPGAVEIDKLHLASPGLEALRAAGVKLVAPLVSQGELIGLLNLGPRLSEQDYSTDDRRLLTNLGTQAAPAVRVAQLVKQQQEEFARRERIEQELRVARIIQQTLLPKEVPALAGYHVAAYYQPARAVGGDFYDFIPFPDGRIGLIIGDVTDKGVPAALVMATTRSILRGAASQTASPGEVLQRANDLLHPDIPPKMFVTCLYAILDPASGYMKYANAGHDAPYHRHAQGVSELRARGMPLGLMPGMFYEEKETTLAAGDTVLFYSDGLVEAHAPDREMFGFPRLMRLMGERVADDALIAFLNRQLADFTGADWEQEDDVTLVTLQRAAAPTKDEGRRTDGPTFTEESAAREMSASPVPSASSALSGVEPGGDRVLAEFSLASQPGNEREAMQTVAQAVAPLALPSARVERLKTAVAEATMNAMEHGNGFRADVPVRIRVATLDGALSVKITDQGADHAIPDAAVPDLDAKLAGLQSPRGWGLFLIKNMVDEVRVTSDNHHHTVELILSLGGDNYASPSA